MNKDYASIDYNIAIKDYETDIKSGLTNKEASSRLIKYGNNELVEHNKINPLKILITQFSDPMIIILLIAVVITFLLGDTIDSILITIIVIINAIVGFSQEYKAEKSIEALKKISSPHCNVVREGIIVNIKSKNLVPGDIILIEAGSIVPADARIIEHSNLRISEAALTGESIAVNKQTKPVTTNHLADRKCIVYSGTSVVLGKAKAVVINTGMNTEIGKIASMVQETERIIPLQVKLEKMAGQIGKATGLIVIIIFIVGLLQNNPILEMFKTSVSLGVAAIPEGLPVVVTVALALGVSRMTKRNVLMRKMAAVETLGRVNIICSDKTGTITKNEMTVKQLYVDNVLLDVEGIGYEVKGEILNSNKVNKKSLELLLKTGMLCNDAKLNNKGNPYGDPTELALLVAGMKYYDEKMYLERVDAIEFDSDRKMMSTLHKQGNSFVQYTKGAPERILNKCTMIIDKGKSRKITTKDKTKIINQYNLMASQAMRVLGFACNKTDKLNENKLTFVGLQGMIDPPRDHVKEAFSKAINAGIQVKMITGDYKETAVAIGKLIGMSGKVITGEQIDKLNDNQLNKIINTTEIFSRVTAEQKLRILNMLEKDNVVAMTGDGVNDAPAIKKASIGITVANGTDVARESSDMVLLDSHFKSIVVAIEEGRTIFSNIRKFISFLLTCNLAEVAIIFFATIIGLPLPLAPVHLLWINLVTDGPPAVALGVDPPSKNIMKKKPINKNEEIINGKLIRNIILIGSLITVIVLGLFNHYNVNSTLIHARTMAFTTIIMFEFVIVQSVRRSTSGNLFTNMKLVFALFISLGLTLIIMYIPFLQNIFELYPLGMYDWGIIIGLSIILYILDYLIIKIVNKICKKKKEGKKVLVK